MGPMGILVTVVLGLIFVIVIYSLVPTIGSSVKSAAPVGDAVVVGTLGKSGGWNYSVWNISSNQAMTNASEVWAGFSGLPPLAIMAIVCAVVIGAFLLLGRY